MGWHNLLHCEIFQFQCGAIEGSRNSGRSIVPNGFQFQCGAIEGINVSLRCISFH